MSKTYYTSGTGAQQTLSNAQDEKIPIYANEAALDADMSNLKVGQIVGTKSGHDDVIDQMKAYIRDQNELSDFEEINKSSIRIVSANTDTPSSSDYTCPYDGFLLFSYNYVGAQGPQILFSEDGVSWKKYANNNPVILGMLIDTVATQGGWQIFVKKGWKIAYLAGQNQDRVANAGAFWYKKRDYSNRQ